MSLTLTAGQYLIVCFIESADGVPHLAKGMIRAFTVTGAVRAETVRPDGEIVLSDFTISLPDGFTGKGTYRVVNHGSQPHEFIVVRLAPGKTLEDFGAWLQVVEKQGFAAAGPPPAIPMGGVQVFGRGPANYVHLNLGPGEYAALCGVPDPASGKSHAEMGMLLPFTIR